MIPPVFCDYPTPYLWLFSSNVPPVIYYAHFIALGSALLVGLFVLISNRRALQNKILFFTLFFFFIWVFESIIFWAANSSDSIMFTWSLTILVEPLVYLGGLYLFYVTTKKQDVKLLHKILFLIPYLPVALAIPTGYALPGFDLNNCLSVEGFISVYYTYPLELFYTVVLIILAIKNHRQTIDPKRRKEIFLLATGIVFFLLAFSWGNIVSSFTEDWNFAQIGLFAVPIFIGFLGYTIVKFQTFSIKVAGSIVLASALWLAEFALIFLQQNNVSRLITIITLMFTTIVGIMLVFGVHRDVRRREEMTELAHSLEKANIRLKELDQQKTEFLSIASHQLRTPLSIIKGYIELIEDGAYGKPSAKLLGVLHDMDVSNERLVKLVDEFLDITRIEQGRTKYTYEKSSICKLAEDVVKELAPRAEEAGYTLVFKEPDEDMQVIMDAEKIRNVIFNYTDNAIKYSGKGKKIIVSIEDENGGVSVRVKDQGMGFGKSDEAKFFQKFYRGENVKGTNVNGTGLGIYVCRMFIETHHGRVWARSQGLGKGSEFGFWIPEKQPGV